MAGLFLLPFAFYCSLVFATRRIKGKSLYEGIGKYMALGAFLALLGVLLSGATLVSWIVALVAISPILFCLIIYPANN